MEDSIANPLGHAPPKIESGGAQSGAAWLHTVCLSGSCPSGFAIQEAGLKVAPLLPVTVQYYESSNFR